MNRVNKSQYAILGWLSKGAMSGYDLKQKFNRITPFHWTESNAQIYPILKKLEAKNWVISHLDVTSGKRNRRIYRITPAGLRILEIWLKAPINQASYREEVLLKLTMSERLSTPEIRQHIEHYYKNIKQQITLLSSVIAHTNRLHANAPDSTYLHMTFDFARKMLYAKREWCQEILAKL